jgi:hypothetical protein
MYYNTGYPGGSSPFAYKILSTLLFAKREYYDLLKHDFDYFLGWGTVELTLMSAPDIIDINKVLSNFIFY